MSVIYTYNKFNINIVVFFYIRNIFKFDEGVLYIMLGEPTNQTRNPAFTINLFTLVIYTYTLVVTILKYEL